MALAAIAAILSFAVITAAGLTALAAGLLDGATAGILVACTGLLPVLAFAYVGEYPKRLAYYTRVHSLGDMPEVVSYIVMSMKLTQTWSGLSGLL
jgi:membrane protease YdiL (CAAX protease family)